MISDSVESLNTLPSLDMELPPSPSAIFGASNNLTTPNIYMPNILGSGGEPHLTGFVMNQNISDSITAGVFNCVLQDTTLCTVAFRIVNLCNKKNVNVLELDSKLRCGYRNASTPLEGCRVDNWVLLSVLAEIIH